MEGILVEINFLYDVNYYVMVKANSYEQRKVMEDRKIGIGLKPLEVINYN